MLNLRLLDQVHPVYSNKDVHVHKVGYLTSSGIPNSLVHSQLSYRTNYRRAFYPFIFFQGSSNCYWKSFVVCHVSGVILMSTLWF